MLLYFSPLKKLTWFVSIFFFPKSRSESKNTGKGNKCLSNGNFWKKYERPTKNIDSLTWVRKKRTSKGDNWDWTENRKLPASLDSSLMKRLFLKIKRKDFCKIFIEHSLFTISFGYMSNYCSASVLNIMFIGIYWFAWMGVFFNLPLFVQ